MTDQPIPSYLLPLRGIMIPFRPQHRLQVFQKIRPDSMILEVIHQNGAMTTTPHTPVLQEKDKPIPLALQPVRTTLFEDQVGEMQQ